MRMASRVVILLGMLVPVAANAATVFEIGPGRSAQIYFDSISQWTPVTWTDEVIGGSGSYDMRGSALFNPDGRTCQYAPPGSCTPSPGTFGWAYQAGAGVPQRFVLPSFAGARNGLLTFVADDQSTIRITYTGQGVALPEPASWALMLLGFGVLGAAMRQRRSGSAPRLPS